MANNIPNTSVSLTAQLITVGKIGPVIERDIIQRQTDQTIRIIQSNTRGNDRTEVATLSGKSQVAQAVSS